MSDGSNLGITAGRALGTILGGDDQPAEDEKTSKEETFKRVMAAPSPLVGEGIFKRKGLGEDAYSLATDCITKAFLLVEWEEPGSLMEQHVYSAETTEIEDLWGKPISGESVMWEKMKKRWPEFDEWLGGASGFMVGFAYNCARWLHDLQIVGNPAIMTVEIPRG